MAQGCENPDSGFPKEDVQTLVYVKTTGSNVYMNKSGNDLVTKNQIAHVV